MAKGSNSTAIFLRDQRDGRLQVPKTPTSWWDGMSDIERKAYLQAHPGSKYAKEAKKYAKAKVASREDYHWGSAAFHRGKVAAITAAIGKPGDPHYDAYDNAPRLTLSQHRKAQDLHNLALQYLKELNHPQKGVENRKLYEDTLNRLKGLYAEMDEIARRQKQASGIGNTRWVGKETAADWWDNLPPAVRRNYLKKHPNSAKAAGGGRIMQPKPKPPAPPPAPVIRQPIPKPEPKPAPNFPSPPENQTPEEFLRPISFPRSKFAGAFATGLEGRIKWRQDELMDFGRKTATVKPKNLFASQDVVDTRWTPEWGKAHNRFLPVGMLDSEGNVHVLDGHHRADFAVRNGKSTKFHLFGPHTEADEAEYQKVRDQYEPAMEEAAMVRLELSANHRWTRLTNAEKVAYLKAYPKSRFTRNLVK